MNERYGKFLAAAPDPWEARRRLVDHARVHGAGAAARMSGACGSAIYKLLKRAEAGTLRPSPRGRPPRLTPEDEALRGFHLRKWNGTPEKVKGIVEKVRYGDAGDLNGVRVLRTWVEVTPDTDIDFDD